MSKAITFQTLHGQTLKPTEPFTVLITEVAGYQYSPAKQAREVPEVKVTSDDGREMVVPAHNIPASPAFSIITLKCGLQFMTPQEDVGQLLGWT